MKISRKITADVYNDNLNRFFNEIRDYEPLSKADEKILIAKIQKTNDVSSLDKLVKANVKFVISVAKKYQGGGVPLLDLISEGNDGLIEAAYRFDVRKEWKFFSYAVWWIRKRIISSFDYNVRTIQLPANREALVTKIKKIISELEQKLQRYPNVDDICERYQDLNEDDIIEAVLHAGYNPSLQDGIGSSKEHDNEDTLEDVLSNNELGIDAEDIEGSLAFDLNKFLYQLSQREYDIFIFMFGLNGEDHQQTDNIAGKLKMKSKDVAKFKPRVLKRLKALKNIDQLREYL